MVELFHTPKVFVRYGALIVVAAILVVFSYFWVDRPVVYFVNAHYFNPYSIFYWMQRLPEAFVVVIPAAYLILLIRWDCGYTNSYDKFIFILIMALLVTIAFVDELKFIFGRYWPATFVENNPSLLRDGAYGFNWFHGGRGYRSFPSGHTATIVAAMTVIWHFYPRLRWLSIAGCAAVAIGLIGMKYHYVSDIIAGGCLGFLIASSIVVYVGAMIGVERN